MYPYDYNVILKCLNCVISYSLARTFYLAYPNLNFRTLYISLLNCFQSERACTILCKLIRRVVFFLYEKYLATLYCFRCLFFSPHCSLKKMSIMLADTFGRHIQNSFCKLSIIEIFFFNRAPVVSLYYFWLTSPKILTRLVKK